MIEFADTPGEIAGPPPLLGEHSAEVLRELGYAEADVERLLADGVVLAPAAPEITATTGTTV